MHFRELNALTSDPVKLTNDLVNHGGPNLGGGGGGGGDDPGGRRSKAYAPAIVPVVPSEAAYGAADGDPFQVG